MLDFLPDRKLSKYFSRETAAAVVTAGQLLKGKVYDQRMPLYYATGISEHEDYGLPSVVAASTDREGIFSQEQFSLNGFSDVSPLNQFRVLLNMPICFVSIVYRLTGDNAVLYGSAAGLLAQARCAPSNGQLLLGAGKTYQDGMVETGFAIMNRTELDNYIKDIAVEDEPIELIRCWSFKKRDP